MLTSKPWRYPKVYPLAQGLAARLRRQRIDPRHVLIADEFSIWVKKELPNVASTLLWGEGQSAAQQLKTLFREFQQCDRMHIPSSLRCLNEDEGVWELKTGDLRIFGWFRAIDVFVAADGGDAYVLKESKNGYGEKIESVIKIRREHVGVFIRGGDARAVISD